MTSGNRAGALVVFVIAVVVSGNFGCGGGMAVPPPPSISVSLSNASATVQAGSTTQFTAMVMNDSAAKGVTWSVFCSAAACGSVVPASTASGSPTTYTAPAATPASDLKVTLTAASAADTTKSASAAITIPAIAVSISPASANVHTGVIAPFTATVSNDPSSGGVTWSLTQGGSSCSPGCGTVAPTGTASGRATAYTAPASLPTNPAVTLTATSVTDSSKTGSATISLTDITVTVAPSSAQVPSGGTQQFTATVTGDPSNAGVAWSLLQGRRTCAVFRGCGPVSYSACTSGCGTVSPVNTASGTPTIYTAPAHFTPPPGGRGSVFVGIFLLATSTSNSGASGQAALSVLPISVSVSPTPASVVVNNTQQFTATVSNDGTSSGVTWTLTLNGAACSPACGTIDSTKTAGGAPIMYTAPSSVPAFPFPVLTATSVEDPTQSASASISITTPSGAACGAGSGSESLLKGHYAFLLNGFNSQNVVVMAASFTADGTGKVTAGEQDSNSANVLVTDATFDPTTSFYFVGPDRRGCLALSISGGGTTYFRFALGSVNGGGVSTTGHIIEFDDTTGTGTRAAGTIWLQDPSSFSTSKFNGSYVFGLVGTDSNGTPTRLAAAGTFVSDGASAISGTLDSNDAGTISSDVSSSGGTFTCCSNNGRGVLVLPNNVGVFTTPTLPFYMVDAAHIVFVNSGFGQYSGEAFGVPDGTAFSEASLNGVSVLRQTAASSSGAIVDIATATADGTGGITVKNNTNNAGTFTTGSTGLTYAVDSGGRVTLSGESTPPVLYLFEKNRGFLVGTDATVSFGILEPQATGPFGNASLSGAYTLGTENPSAGTVDVDSGVVNANGAGSASGTSDSSGSSGLNQNQASNFNYSISADGTGDFGSDTTAILISGNELIFINNTSRNPSTTVVEK
jgi:hypothetical protein